MLLYGHKARMMAVAGACVATLALAACGSDDADTGNTSQETTAGGADVATAQENVERYYAANSADNQPPSGPEAQTGKKVFYLSAGTATPSGSAAVKEIEKAADILEWDLTVFDGQFSPDVYQEGIRQAIANQQDGLILYGVDCPGLEKPLQQAKEAGIVIVGVSSIDCDAADPSAEGLIDAEVVTLDGLDQAEQWKNFGRAQADWITVQTDGDAKVIHFAVPDFLVTDLTGQGFEEELAKVCEGCEIVETVQVGVADFGPQLQEKAEQALLRNPDANAVQVAYDDLMTLGVAKAVENAEQASGNDLAVVAGTGYEANMDLIRQDKGQDAGWVQGHQWDMYAAADILNRAFAGEDTAAGVGYPTILYDRDNNMPPSGAFEFEADFRTPFESGWTGEE